MVIKSHEIPESIVLDSDKIFTSKIWRELYANVREETFQNIN